MSKELRDEYYKWQWVTKPSEDPGSFCSLKTNQEIAGWWLSKFTSHTEELKKKIEGKRKESEKFVPFQRIHYQSALDDIITELNHQ